MVHPGPGGRLVYAPDGKGDVIPDYSHAGYKGGGVKLPDAPVRMTLKPGGGNDAGRIQAAIDKVSALSPDKRGFRGAILLKRGRYELEKPLLIQTGGVVLRGEGQNEDGTILFGKWTGNKETYKNFFSEANLVIIRGNEGVRIVENSVRKIVDDYVPFGAVSFRVGGIANLRAGDTILVRRYSGIEWIKELGLDYKRWEGKPGSYNFDRIITRIEGDTVTVDAPITIAIEAKWGGGDIVKYLDKGRIQNVGVENLRGISDFDTTVTTNEYGNIDRTPYVAARYYSDETHYWNFISLDNACNAWVCNFTALNFASSCVAVGEGCKWVTVQDCVSLEPVSFCAGGRRFTFHISGQLCLVQRCFSDKGRHSFVLGGTMTCGPNVFLDCIATRPFSSSEPHSSLVVGSLYDNIRAPLAFRFAKSNPVRWMGFNNVMWNCEGMFIVQKPPMAQNYSIGHIGIHAMVFNRGLIEYSWPEGYIESLDEHIQPRSLYLKQLEDRLGKKAVHNVATSVQYNGM
jgi:hypothetical protein